MASILLYSKVLLYQSKLVLLSGLIPNVSSLLLILICIHISLKSYNGTASVLLGKTCLLTYYNIIGGHTAFVGSKQNKRIHPFPIF